MLKLIAETNCTTGKTRYRERTVAENEPDGLAKLAEREARRQAQKDAKELVKVIVSDPFVTTEKLQAAIGALATVMGIE